MVQIDMPLPKCCGTCFALDDTGDYPFCLISKEEMGYTFNANVCRMPHCPLKEQPDVVRCKDCKHAEFTFDGKMCKYCDLVTDECGFLIELYREPEWFCADGERKKTNENH